MVRSKKQLTNELPFFSQQNINNNPLDSTDRILSRFAIAFFGVILLLISFDNNPTSNSSIAHQVKLGSIAKIATADIFYPTTQTVKVKNAVSNSKISNKKKIVEEAKPILVSNKFTEPKSIKTYETIKQPVSYASKPMVINRAPITTSNRPLVRKAVKKESKNMVTKKVTTPKVAKKKSSKNKLVINNKITQDLLPASYFSAKQKAQLEGKPMLIKFGAKWCLPCREMDNTVFKNPQVIDFMKTNYVILSIDVDDFDGYNMKAYYNISALPTMLVFNAHGEFLAKYMNSMSKNKFMTMLKEHQSPNTPQPTRAIVENIPVEKKKAIVNSSVPSNTMAPPQAKIISLVAKKKNGQTIQALKNKAKNWRSTGIEFKTSNLTTGQIIVNVRNLTTGEILSEQTISLAPLLNVGAVTDTTTSIFQLDISHEKKKDKSGEYAIEIFHASPQKVRLIGKTSFLKDGQFIWTK